MHLDWSRTIPANCILDMCTGERRRQCTIAVDCVADAWLDTAGAPSLPNSDLWKIHLRFEKVHRHMSTNHVVLFHSPGLAEEAEETAG